MNHITTLTIVRLNRTAIHLAENCSCIISIHAVLALRVSQQEFIKRPINYK